VEGTSAKEQHRPEVGTLVIQVFCKITDGRQIWPSGRKLVEYFFCRDHPHRPTALVASVCCKLLRGSDKWRTRYNEQVRCCHSMQILVRYFACKFRFRNFVTEGYKFPE